MIPVGEIAPAALYGLAWAVFGFLHSLLADERIKQRLRPRLGAAYRLAYNLFAALTMIAVFWAGYRLLGELPRYDLGGGVKIILTVLEIAGWGLGFLALGRYDLGRFAGTAYLRDESLAENEPLIVAGLHRYVRHPLYSAAFLILWGAAWTPFGLMTAIYGSVYLLIGTALEERRLLARYGDAYADYKARVPAFVPKIGLGR